MMRALLNSAVVALTCSAPLATPRRSAAPAALMCTAVLAVLMCAAVLAASPTNASESVPDGSSPGGTWVCHDPDYPDPCHRGINATGLASARLGWAVGDTGVIMRWDGTSWYPTGSPTRSDLHGLHVVSEEQAWAVGDDSTILYYAAEGGWARLPYDRGRPLYGVHAVGLDDVWIVGSAGFVLHWNGADFTVHTSGVTDDLHAIAMVPPAASGVESLARRDPGDTAEENVSRATDGWLAGGYALLRWNGSEWRPAPQPPDTRHDIRDIQLTSTVTGWAVGRTILRLDGGLWREAVSSRDVDGLLNDLNLETDARGWAVGDSRFWQLAGPGWSVFDDTAEDEWQYTAVSAPRATRPGWVFGGSEEGELEIRRLDVGDSEDAWDIEARHEPTWSDPVSVVSESDAWRAVGGGALEQWDGSSWSRTDSPGQGHSPFWHDIDALDGQTAWAVAADTVMAWDGLSWSETPAFLGLLGVTVVSPADAWAVGMGSVAEGGLIARWDGAAWSRVDSPTRMRLWAVDASGPDDAWAVGERGTIVHWDGSTWTKTISPTEAELHDVAVAAPDSAWAVGYGSDAGGDALLHWDGSDWIKVQVPGPTPLYLRSVAANGECDVWAGGATGNLIHWDGTSWSWHPSEATSTIVDIDFGSGAGWAGGSTMLRYVPPPGPNALFVPLAGR